VLIQLTDALVEYSLSEIINRQYRITAYYLVKTITLRKTWVTNFNVNKLEVRLDRLPTMM
jgi:hypothetical protein